MEGPDQAIFAGVEQEQAALLVLLAVAVEVLSGGQHLVQKAVKQALGRVGLTKSARCHRLLHSFAPHLLERGQISKLFRS